MVTVLVLMDCVYVIRYASLRYYSIHPSSLPPPSPPPSLSHTHTLSSSLPLSQGWTGASCNVSLVESSQVFSSVISSSQIFNNDYYISTLTSLLSQSSSVTTSTVPVAAVQDNLILNKSINECNNGTINR